MHIYCTKRMTDFMSSKYIDVEFCEKDTELDLFSWHANIYTNGDKDLLLLVNDLTSMSLVFFGIKPSDMSNIFDLLVPAIYNAFLNCGLDYSDCTAMKKWDTMVPRRSMI